MNATACYFMNAMAAENTEIARGLRRRDPDLLDHLIEKYQHRLLRYLLHLTGRRELAEDFFQETWIRVLDSFFRAFHHWEGTSPGHWRQLQKNSAPTTRAQVGAA